MKDEQKRRDEEQERVTDRQSNEQVKIHHFFYFSFKKGKIYLIKPNFVKDPNEGDGCGGDTSPDVEQFEPGRCSPSNQVNIDVDDE